MVRCHFSQSPAQQLSISFGTRQWGLRGEEDKSPPPPPGHWWENRALRSQHCSGSNLAALHLLNSQAQVRRAAAGPDHPAGWLASLFQQKVRGEDAHLQNREETCRLQRKEEPLASEGRCGATSRCLQQILREGVP